LIDKSDLEKYDTIGMFKVYDKWPQFAKESYEKNFEPIDFRFIDHIVFSGMGGSGSIGDIFQSILSKANVHVSVIKGYQLPKTVDSNTLVVTTSISGNTVETNTVLNSAYKMNCNVIAFTAGGKMGEYCKKNNVEIREIQQIHSPRASFTVFLYSILKILSPIVSIKKNEIEESINYLESISKQINSLNLSSTNPSLSLAEWLPAIPMIYYPAGLQAAAIRFKSSLQENAKSHAMIEDMIEACHNGIVSWEKPSNIKPILLQGEDDYIKTKERWKILKEYFDKNNIDYKEIFSVKGNILSKLINMIYILDYATIYRAVILKVDPSPVKSIDFIKSKL